jgi:hypothetical protein
MSAGLSRAGGFCTETDLTADGAGGLDDELLAAVFTAEGGGGFELVEDADSLLPS